MSRLPSKSYKKSLFLNCLSFAIAGCERRICDVGTSLTESEICKVSSSADRAETQTNSKFEIEFRLTFTGQSALSSLLSKKDDRMWRAHAHTRVKLLVFAAVSAITYATTNDYAQFSYICDSRSWLTDDWAHFLFGGQFSALAAFFDKNARFRGNFVEDCLHIFFGPKCFSTHGRKLL